MTYLMTVMIVLNLRLRYISLWSSIFAWKYTVLNLIQILMTR